MSALVGGPKNLNISDTRLGKQASAVPSPLLNLIIPNRAVRAASHRLTSFAARPHRFPVSRAANAVSGAYRAYPELMLRRRLLITLLCAAAAAAGGAQSAIAPQRPKLVLGIVIDQFRYDYMTRFRGDYTGGFARLYDRGAFFTNARYEHFPAVTAAGHSVFMTGAMPAVSGIAGNEWFDRESGKQVTCVSDDTVQLLGGKPGAAGSSPRRLLVTTVGDEMKLAAQGRPRVIGISLKDRAAILPAGSMADGAYWFDGETGNFVSSTFYFPDLPAWVKEFNARRSPDKYLNAEWTPLVPSPDWPAFSKRMAGQPGPGFYNALEATPYGNELIEQFAEAAILAERLGQRGTTDLLTVSFSSNDYVGHRVGPHAPEARDISIRTDRLIGKLFEFLEARIGMQNVLIAFTADHGVAPLPEVMQKYRGPGGRFPDGQILAVQQAALAERFGEGKWIIASSGASPYLNRELIRAKNLGEPDVERVAAEAAAALPHVFRAYTRDQLEHGAFLADSIGRRVANGFVPKRSPDVVVIDDPFWLSAAAGTSHSLPFGYDVHVPLVLMGPGIRPGIYERSVMPNDIAPTLASLLWIETPAGSAGSVLTEALDGR